MRNSTLWIALLILAAPVLSSAQSYRGYRGYYATEDMIATRLLNPNSNFSMITYSGGAIVGGLPSLADLLGTYISGTDSKFLNSSPNVLNALIWNVIFSGIAKDVSKICVGGDTNDFVRNLRPEVKETFRQMCVWPSGTAKSEGAMVAIWLTVMGYDAPEEEYLAWKAFFLNSEYAKKSGKEVLWAMMISMFNQPYFLLEQ